MSTEDYLQLLPKLERDFLEELLKTKQIGNVGGEKYERLVALLERSPYPTLSILQDMFRGNKVNLQIGNAIRTGLELLLANCERKHIASFTLISFIAQFPLSLLEASTLRREFIDTLASLLRHEGNDNIYLALLARLDSSFVLDAIHELCYSKLGSAWLSDEHLPSKEYVLVQALKQRKHFVSVICEQLQCQFASTIQDAAIRNNMIILKLIDQLQETSQSLETFPDLDKWLECFVIEKSPQDLQDIHRFFHADMQRLWAIIRFLKQQSNVSNNVSVDAILQTNTALGLLYQQNIKTNYEETRQLIETTHMWQQRLGLAESNNLNEQELETFTYYTILATVLDVLLAGVEVNQSEFYVAKMQSLQSLLRQLHNMDVLCAVIEDIFQLMFLRWEHLTTNDDVKTTDTATNSRIGTSSGSDSSAEATAATPVVTPTHSKMRQGFICRCVALQAIFTQLKKFVTRKVHSEDYKQATEHVQLRFQRIMEIISGAIWKYTVLEKIDDSLARANAVQQQQQHRLPADELQQLVQLHVDTVEKSSSDDECRDCEHTRIGQHYHSLSRRKAVTKKRRRSTFSGPVTVQKSPDIVIDTASHCEPVKRAEHKPCDMTMCFAERSIIPKMLCSPECLAIMALALNNLEDAKYIIQNFGLQNSELERELSFLEQQQQVKQKLATIYANYAEQERNEQQHDSQRPKATVEQIKQVAAKGFEVSKLISVVDNFAKTQRVEQPPHVQRLLQRYAGHTQYGSCLRQFDERHLNAVIVCDLILNLPLDREITASIVMIIKRQQQLASGIVLSTGNAANVNKCSDERSTRMAASPLPRDIGSMPLLESLAECLRLLPERCSLPELLSNSYYPLKPRRLTIALQRQRAFEAVFDKSQAELARIEQLRANVPLFQALQSKSNYYTRFQMYVTQLSRLLQLRDSNLEYHTSELLQRDAYEAAGELLFECGLTPIQLEPHISALYLNLLHVLALNLCPEVAPDRHLKATPATAEKQQMIVDFIAKPNRLLAYLLQCILSNGSYMEEGTYTQPNAAACTELCSTYLFNCAHLVGMEQLAVLYGGNRIVALLLSDVLPSQQLLDVHLTPQQQLELLLLQFGNRSASSEMQQIDRLVIELIEADSHNIELAALIRGDMKTRAELIQKHFTRITTTRLAKELIEQTLCNHRAVELIPTELRTQLEATLADITVYARVSGVMEFEPWPQAYDFGQRTPSTIFQRLLQKRHYRLCYEWCGVVKLATKFPTQRRVFLDALSTALLQLTDDTECNDAQEQPDQAETEMLLRILETFPLDDRVAFMDAHKDRFRALWLLTYTIDFLSQQTRGNAGNSNNAYHNYRISLVIFGQLSLSERMHFWPLLKFPLLIIEQLIMNVKFELLSKVLTAVRCALSEKSQPQPVCAFCFDKRGGNIYNIHAKVSNPGGNGNGSGISPSQPLSSSSAFMLLNFNLYQPDHMLTGECIDLLLRIYATKALDYYIADGQSSWEQISQSTDRQHSLDSLCDAFRMPRTTPARDEWVRDEEATHCMCCRRAKFTMLMRRHHCRRCGRVVCYACSMHRQRIPDSIYEDLPVRVCNDCHRHTEEEEARADVAASKSAAALSSTAQRESTKLRWPLGGEMLFKWQLSGNITHDKLLREEFCYEHAPSVALCLSILDYHVGREKCIDLLLYHCRHLERLIVPNPEVDYALVAKMMNCLALAAKVRGAPAEIESIREHAEIIAAVVQHGCEALIPPGPLSNHSLRKLADSLVQAENWSLALEVHLKCGFPTAGVMAAHGLACLRAGCFDTAREKFTYCMTKLSTELTNSKLLQCLQQPTQAECEQLPHIKRPQRGPPLLQEIVKLIESTAPHTAPQEETLKRASLIRNSNTSLATLLARQRREPLKLPPLHEPALNVLNTLANLKHISKGQYGAERVMSTSSTSNVPPTERLDNRRMSTVPPMQSKDFEECMHYLLTYGSHADILSFLVERQQSIAALQYVRIQQLDAELFIQHVYLPALRIGRVSHLLDSMLQLDARLLCWRQVLLQTCRFLEQKQLLNSLYQLQLLLKDPVRASMTCVRFYTMHCENFQQLHANAEHLHNAHRHLQSELEMAQWENIKMDGNPVAGMARGRRKSSTGGGRRSSTGGATAAAAAATTTATAGAATAAGGSLMMQMDARALNGHINTISRQLEVAKFLAYCERRQNSDDGLITERILKQIRLESGKSALPTLFDTMQEKIQICILLLLCGKNLEEGYGLAYRVIDAYKLPTIKVFGATARYLARNKRLSEVEKLLSCIGSNNNGNGCISDKREIDEILSIAINSASNNHEPEVKVTLDNLTKRIHSVEMRISSHIFIGQLKSAYLLANKYERLSDIRRILREAERTNQTHIKKLCEKKLSISNSMNANMNVSTSANANSGLNVSSNVNGNGNGNENGNATNL